MNNKILVIDSGLGGLTTLSEIRLQLKNADIIYYADDSFLPYGDKTSQQLLVHLTKVIEGFIGQIKGVVLACNTATGATVERLRSLFSFPIIGTEPAVLPACKTNGKSLVLVTPLESCQSKFTRLIKDKDVLVYAPTSLAQDIEQALVLGGSLKEFVNNITIKKHVKNIVKLAKENSIQKIVLGCTHYVYLKLCKELKGFTLIEGNQGVAKRAACFFKNEGQGSIEIIFGSGDKKKSQIALELLKELSNFRFKPNFN